MIGPRFSTDGVLREVSHAPGYYKDLLGIVRLRGLVITSGVTNSVLFTLPLDYRPDATCLFATSASLGASSGYGRVDVPFFRKPLSRKRRGGVESRMARICGNCAGRDSAKSGMLRVIRVSENGRK